MQLLLNKTVKPRHNLFKKYFNSSNKQKNNNEAITLTNDSEKKNNRKNSMNIKNKIIIKMKQLEKKSKYKRNIYKLLYDQIHTDIADIDKEIKTGKNLIVPYALLKRNLLKNEFLLNKKLNKLDIKELQKEENNNDINSTKNDSKINIPKIKKFNIINNSLITNTTTINTSERKENKINNNTTTNFSKFKNLSKSNIINLKSRNMPNINIVKAITDQNIEYKDNLLLQENDDINDKNTINVDKNITKTTLLRVPEIKKSKRKKCLYVSYDEKWYLKNKFIYIKLDKLEIENNYIQSQIIGDQFALINESIKHITSKYFVDKDIANKFNATNLSNQKLININIEESIGLMIEISYILLEKFENCLENFITKIFKRQNKNEYKIVEDEKKEFNINLTLFIETSQFFGVSYKSYLILLDKDEYYKIDKYNFDKIVQFLDRLRLGVNKIILDLQNVYNMNNIREKKIITNCVKKIIRIKEQKESYEKKPKLDCHKKFCAFRSGIDPFKYKGKIRMKITEDNEINMRIKKALGYRNDNDKNFDIIKKFDIGSKLVNNLMKYGTKEFREFIIYERIRRKFYERQRENDSEEDSD